MKTFAQYAAIVGHDGSTWANTKGYLVSPCHEKVLLQFQLDFFMTSNHMGLFEIFSLFAKVQEDESKTLVSLLTGETPLDSIAAEGFFIAGQKYVNVPVPFSRYAIW